MPKSGVSPALNQVSQDLSVCGEFQSTGMSLSQFGGGADKLNQSYYQQILEKLQNI